MKKKIKKLPKSHRKKFIRFEKGGLKAHLEFMESERMKEQYKLNRKLARLNKGGWSFVKVLDS